METPSSDGIVNESGFGAVGAIDPADAEGRFRTIFRMDEEKFGRVRNLTAATAHSDPVWRAVTRSLQLFGSLRRLDRKLVSVVCLYTSVLHHSDYCIDDCAADALERGWTAADLRSLGDAGWEARDPAVAAALGYCRRIASGLVPLDAEYFDELIRIFGDEGMVELTGVISMKIFWNKLAGGLGITPEFRCDRGVFESLLELSRTLQDEVKDA